MKLYCGTSGFSFKEWKGPFYPKNLPANKMLAFYVEHLPTVEINNTFYRMPRRNLLEAWAAQVPDTFRFAIKAPRRITQVKQLLDCKEEAGYRSVRDAFTFFCMRQRKRLKRRSAPRVFSRSLDRRT